MEDRAFDLLVKMVESNKRDTDNRFNEVNVKLDSLLQWKWKVAGISIFMMAIFEVGSRIVIEYLKKT